MTQAPEQRTRIVLKEERAEAALLLFPHVVAQDGHDYEPPVNDDEVRPDHDRGDSDPTYFRCRRLNLDRFKEISKKWRVHVERNLRSGAKEIVRHLDYAAME